MKNYKISVITLVFYSFLAFGLDMAEAEMTTVFSDNYDTVWDATPTPAGMLASYIGVPNVSGGVARGIGSGYGDPLYTWMVKPLSFTAETLEVTLRGQSGPNWPNQAAIYLMDVSWGGHGQQEIGYAFLIYGESSNYRFAIVRNDPDGGHYLASYYIGSEIIKWHTYVVARDAMGNWSLTMDGNTCILNPNNGDFMNPDLSYTDFAYIGTFLYRDQSALDYVEVRIPEPAIAATVDIDPNTLNLQSKGKWITAYIQLPTDCNIADVNSATVLLEGQIKADWTWVEEEEQMMMAKFSRSAVQDMLQPGQVELRISGELIDGRRFEGTDTITIINKGKSN
jgi:hypothetical protein